MVGGRKLLQVVIHEPDWAPSLMSLCAGYETAEWRSEPFASEIFSWLPTFALPWSEQQTSLGSESAVKLLRKAAKVLYRTEKYQKRGEFGELILHGVLLQEFGTEAAVTKFWFKDAENDTVKGFDVVHISNADDTDVELHLWLGEAKFYKDLSDGVREAAKSLEEHFTHDYLRSEFMLVSNKIDPDAPFADRLRVLLDENTSLDEVFSVLHIPVLVTFDSAALATNKEHCEEYFDQLRDEVVAGWKSFHEKAPEFESGVVVHLIVIPLDDKNLLSSLLHRKLESWQRI